MRYHLSDNLSNSYYQRTMLSHGGTGNVLFSYITNPRADGAINNLRRYNEYNIIIDSGAFSVWNSGKSIDKAALLDYYQKLQAFRNDIYFVNLDVIPGERGRKPTPEEATAACEAGWQNYLEFKKAGINVLPVFHEDDNWDYLEKMKNETDYICISPANDSTRQQRMIWLDRVYANLKADYKTHGLAATAEKLLERYPFYSVDSVNWKVPAMWGQSKVEKDRRVTGVLARAGSTKIIAIEKEIDFYIQLQENITELWKKRGVVWLS